MAQKTFTAGEVLTASDVNTYLMGEGGAWTSWTPTVTQSGSVTVTNTRSRYARYGRTIIATFSLAVTGSGTTSNDITVSLPVTGAATACGGGSGYIINAGTGYYVGHWRVDASSMRLYCHLETTATGSDPDFALASGDSLIGTITYEAAS